MTLLIFAVMLGVPAIFMFFVTGRFGAFALSTSWAKYCEACGATWEVLYRSACPKCGTVLSGSNMFTSAADWRKGQEAAKTDPVMAKAFELAQEHRQRVRDTQ